jgi:hypothetical protein
MNRSSNPETKPAETHPSKGQASLQSALHFVGRWLPIVGGAAIIAGCEGRPFKVEGERREAPPTERND